MDKKLGVKVVYRNSKLEPVYEKVCSFEEYIGLIRLDLLRLVGDVEETIYAATNNKAKDEWDDAVWTGFCKVKHKLLDKAGEIGRLKENIFEYKEGENGEDSLGKTGENTECLKNYSSRGIPQQ